MSDRPGRAPRREVELTIDGTTVRVQEGTTILQACRAQKIDTPTLCYLETLTPVNVCRVCVVEVEGSRVLVPACSRPVEPKMVVRTGWFCGTERCGVIDTTGAWFACGVALNF